MSQTQPQKQKEVKLFNNRYALKKKLSSGTFGVVFIGQEKDTNQFYAIKLEKCEEQEEQSSLDREVQILQKLKGLQNVPQLVWYGYEYRYNVIVMDLFGRDLSHFMKINKKFSTQSVVKIAVSLIKVLEGVHGRCVIHRDLKPENIVIGRDDTKNQVYLIDFGISKIFKDSSGRHLNFKENKPFIGTARYASIAAHQGKELSRKDDLESLGYVLIYFLRGNLPWQNLKDVEEDERIQLVGEMKNKANLNELCKDLPEAFIKYMNYCKQILYKQTPDYGYLINLFDDLVTEYKINSPSFEWDWHDQKKESEITRDTKADKQHQSLKNI